MKSYGKQNIYFRKEILSPKQYKRFQERQENKGRKQYLKDHKVFSDWQYFVNKARIIREIRPYATDDITYCEEVAAGMENNLVRRGYIDGLLYVNRQEFNK